MDYEEAGSIPTLDAAIVVLRTPSSQLGPRIEALRFLQSYCLDSSNKVHPRLRKNINELVLSNVLSIVMGEDRISDLRRRQLIKAECFIILGNLLGSNTLFGGVAEKIDEIELQNLRQHQQEEKGESNFSTTMSFENENEYVLMLIEFWALWTISLSVPWLSYPPSSPGLLLLYPTTSQHSIILTSTLTTIT